jgi:hypothetical protein
MAHRQRSGEQIAVRWRARPLGPFAAPEKIMQLFSLLYYYV